MRRYHRFEVVGLERIERAGPAMIVGYHGRPIAHDLCMLQALLRERGGPEPRPVMHEAALAVPVLRWLIEGVGFVTGDGDDMARAIERGDPIIVTPGGTREGCRSSRDRYRVSWGERHGYLKLALKYGLSIVPTAAIGVDDTYLGLNDGYEWGKKMRVPGRLPLWLGLGPLGPWPLSPPFPVKITQHIGEPIDVPREAGASPDKATLAAMHHRVIAAVQGLLDHARSTLPRAPQPRAVT